MFAVPALAVGKLMEGIRKVNRVKEAKSLVTLRNQTQSNRTNLTIMRSLRVFLLAPEICCRIDPHLCDTSLSAIRDARA